MNEIHKKKNVKSYLLSFSRLNRHGLKVCYVAHLTVHKSYNPSANLQWRHSAPSRWRRTAVRCPALGVKSASSAGAARIVRRFSRWTSQGSASGERNEMERNCGEVTLTRGCGSEEGAFLDAGRSDLWENAKRGWINSREAWWPLRVGKDEEEEEEESENRRSTKRRNVFGVALLSRTPWAKPVAQNVYCY